jgi:hypothetical protein
VDLFKRKHKQVLPPLFTDDELTSLTTNYNGVIDFLTGLSDEDYKRTVEVAEIYRKAETEAAKALGIEKQPTAFINPPAEPEAPGSFLDDEPDFLEHEPKKRKGK